MQNKKFITIVLALICFIAQPVFGQEWLVPENEKNVANPLEYNLDNVKKGKAVYQANCKSCHGDPGKNNALPLVPPPPDVTSEKMQANSDGALHYKITAGKGGMPQFETTLSDDDRWRLVTFIRNYSSDREPVLVDAPPVNAKLLASVNEEQKIVEVFAEYEAQTGTYATLQGAPVIISAKKTFGNLVIGEALTDKNGRAEFHIPESLIGDEEGFVDIVVALEENYKSEIVTLGKAKVGKQKVVPQLIRKEVLWSTNENVQTWLLLSYIAAAGGAWLAIGYVLVQLFKINRLGKNQKES